MTGYQYRYTLKVYSPGAGYADENGDYITTGSPGWSTLSLCRDESNTAGRTVVLDDGRNIVYEFLILVPRNVTPPGPGTRIQVIGVESETRVDGTVKRSRKDLLHTRIWV